MPGQSSKGYIYGELQLKNGETYQGQMRWENEEAFWGDLFNAYRFDRPIQDMLSEQQAKRVAEPSETFRFGFMELWADRGPSVQYAYHCHFGDLRRLNYHRDFVEATFKNGTTQKFMRRGDLDQDIIIYDSGLGSIDVDPEDIALIRFAATPAGLSVRGGTPIYAHLLTTQGAFEGYVTWDSEECLSDDLISGERKGVDVDIRFGEIIEWKAQDDGSLLTLRSGRTVFLNGHDDVGPGNHGIALRRPDSSHLDIDWRNFISAEFLPPPEPLPTYGDFKAPGPIRGTVTTKAGATFSGTIVYDLDERYDNEMLNGENNGFNYYLPFRVVERVEPQNDKFSLVYLRGGVQLLLGDSGDVTADNQGLLIQGAGNQSTYLPWTDIILRAVTRGENLTPLFFRLARLET